MNRPLAYWAWLLADVSLDRAVAILPTLEFPAIDHAAVQYCINAGPEAASQTPQAFSDRLREQLGASAQSVIDWFDSFPFTAESSRPEWFYWDAHLADLLAVDKAPAPAGVAAGVWQAVIDAYDGRRPGGAVGHGLPVALCKAADARAAVRAVNQAIEEARQQPLTPHDLDVYMRWGWNDEGTQRGLSSLQIGARLGGTSRFWTALSPHLPAAPLEVLAYKRDMASWRLAARLEDFAADARRFGVPAEQMAADVFPKPSPPPSLDAAFLP